VLLARRLYCLQVIVNTAAGASGNNTTERLKLREV
jgi:hypothetical protein